LKPFLAALAAAGLLLAASSLVLAADPPAEAGKDAAPAEFAGAETLTQAPREEAPPPTADKGDVAWMLISTALVMLMVPGLALFYGGMVRRKNVLATMMQSMVCLAIVGVFWIAVGYSLAFGKSHGGWIGWNPDLLFLKGIRPGDLLPNATIPIYLHVLFQGMFAIITPALISGALAERIRFGPFCIFSLLWVTIVYCPLAHWVWAMNWWDSADAGTKAVGFLGKMGALDFAGGTVVHIAAGLSGLAAILVLRKRIGFPEHAFHPNSMVLTVLGAGLLWFGWFGFNGGSALASNELAVSAFGATQAAAAAAAVTWMLAETLHRGKATALGWASGVVAGLVAVTPAAGFIPMWGGLAIGAISGVVCYAAVCLKPKCQYDDSLDAFGVHGVGGFLGAVLTGVFCYQYVQGASVDGYLAGGQWTQVIIQLKAAAISAVFAFVVTVVLVKFVDEIFGLITDPKSESDGLDRTEHGEVGFDFSLATETSMVDPTPMLAPEPRAATVPPSARKGFSVIVEGEGNGDLMEIWSRLCQTGASPPSKEFKAVYPNMTLVEGNRFYFRGGDPQAISKNMEALFRKEGYPIQTHVE